MTKALEEPTQISRSPNEEEDDIATCPHIYLNEDIAARFVGLNPEKDEVSKNEVETAIAIDDSCKLQPA